MWKPIAEAPTNTSVLVRDAAGAVRISRKSIPEDHTTLGTYYGEPRWESGRDDWEPIEWQELPQ